MKENMKATDPKEAKELQQRHVTLYIIERIDKFRYIKIQPKTIDLSTRLRVCGVYSQEPRIEVYCLSLNFNISKLVY